MKRSIFYAIILFLYSCGISQKTQQQLKEKIIGNWNTVQPSQTFYYNLEFNKNGAVFYTTGDTIMYYAYEFKRKNFLLLRDRNSQKAHNKIIKLTQDSLIFENFLEYKTPQVYVRKVSK